jgi:hypothetical protein
VCEDGTYIFILIHTDSDQTFDRIDDVLHNRARMRYIVPETWEKMARTRTAVATDRTQPTSLRVPQTPASEDQNINGHHTVASFR